MKTFNNFTNESYLNWSNMNKLDELGIEFIEKEFNDDMNNIDKKLKYYQDLSETYSFLKETTFKIIEDIEKTYPGTKVGGWYLHASSNRMYDDGNFRWMPAGCVGVVGKDDYPNRIISLGLQIWYENHAHFKSTKIDAQSIIKKYIPTAYFDDRYNYDRLIIFYEF